MPDLEVCRTYMKAVFCVLYRVPERRQDIQNRILCDFSGLFTVGCKVFYACMAGGVGYGAHSQKGDLMDIADVGCAGRLHIHRQGSVFGLDLLPSRLLNKGFPRGHSSKVYVRPAVQGPPGRRQQDRVGGKGGRPQLGMKAGKIFPIQVVVDGLGTDHCVEYM